MGKKTEAQRMLGERKRTVSSLLTAIQAKVDLYGHEECHWGHVGDLGHAVEELQELAAFLGVKL